MNKWAKQYQYIKRMSLYGIKEKPSLWLSIILSFSGSLIEIAGMSLLYPITLISQGILPDPQSKLSILLNYVGHDGKGLLLIFLSLLLLRFILSLINQELIIRAGKDLIAIISSKIFKNVITNISITEINKNGVGHYISLAGDESFRASTTIVNLSQFFNVFCLCIVYYVALATFSLKSFYIVTLFLLSCFLVMWSFFKKMQSFGALQAEHSRSSSLLFIDSLNNVKSIRCYTGEQFVTKSYFKKISDYAEVLIKVDFYQVMFKTFPIILLIILAMIVVQLTLKTGEKLDLFFCVSLIAYLSRFFPSLGQCLNTVLKLMSDSKSGKDVIDLIDYQEYDKHDNQTNVELNNFKKIELKKVNFSYDEIEILNNFNYQFESGKKYGIIGPSGAGKSTLIDLILNFFQPQMGTITIDGVPIKEISSKNLRSKIILMEQRVTIFQTTIFQNITLGSNYTVDEVRSACKLVRMDDFIESLPEKYETTIQYMGANLSGGQKQRIAIARAILRKPEVLILDESLSALDSYTKKEIFTDLCNIFNDKILIIIAHDDWVIEQLNNIIDFKHLENYKQEL